MAQVVLLNLGNELEVKNPLEGFLNFIPLASFSFNSDYSINMQDMNNPEADFYHAPLFFCKKIDVHTGRIFQLYLAKTTFPRVEVVTWPEGEPEKVFKIVLRNCKVQNISLTAVQDSSESYENISLVYSSMEFLYGKDALEPGERRGPEMG